MVKESRQLMEEFFLNLWFSDDAGMFFSYNFTENNCQIIRIESQCYRLVYMFLVEIILTLDTFLSKGCVSNFVHSCTSEL